MTTPLPDERLAGMHEINEKAQNAYVLRVSPRAPEDNDIAWIGDALRDARDLLAEIKRLRATLAPAGEAEGETAVAKAMKEVAKLHYGAYSEPVRAILLDAPDHPWVEELPETLEERRQLPARFHIPMWLDTCEPKSWICAVCWDEGTATSWPCETAATNGGEVFAR